MTRWTTSTAAGRSRCVSEKQPANTQRQARAAGYRGACSCATVCRRAMTGRRWGNEDAATASRSTRRCASRTTTAPDARPLRPCARPPFDLDRLREPDPEHLPCESAKQGPGATGPQTPTPPSSLDRPAALVPTLSLRRGVSEPGRRGKPSLVAPRKREEGRGRGPIVILPRRASSPASAFGLFPRYRRQRNGHQRDELVR